MEAVPKIEDIADEQGLITRAKKGDESAFSALYEHYFPKIYRYLFKRIGNHHITEDITSVTFMKVFCHLDTYSYKQCSFSAWVYRIATNNLIDHYRKAKKQIEVDINDAPEIVDTAVTASDAVDKKYDQDIVRRVLSILTPPKYQEVLHLRFFGELEYDEIAEVMGISINNTRVLLHRALKQFNKTYSTYAEKK